MDPFACLQREQNNFVLEREGVKSDAKRGIVKTLTLSPQPS